MPTIQQYLEEYRAELELDGHDIRRHHWDWHNQHSLSAPPRNTGPEWGTTFDFGTDFLEMHHMMLYGPKGMPGHMPEGIFPWFARKGYTLPPTWDGRQKLPQELDYKPPQKTIKVPVPHGRTITLAHLENYPPHDAPPGYPLPACFTEAGAQSRTQYEQLTEITKLGDFINVNQLGSCISLYHDQWHQGIGGPLSSFYFSTDDPVFYFGVHYTIEQIYQKYLAITGNRAPAETARLIAEAKKKPRIEFSPAVELQIKANQTLRM